jgi:hypothetical protein
MPTILHELVIDRPRELFRARQRARQIAGTLRFSPTEQLLFAVTVFDIACQGWKHQGPVVLRFVLDGDRAQVWLVQPSVEEEMNNGPATPLDHSSNGAMPVWDVDAFQRLMKHVREHPERPEDRPLLDMPLPCRDLGLDREDLPWAIAQLAERTPLRLLDEIEQQNTDLLRLLHQVQTARLATQPIVLKHSSAA